MISREAMKYSLKNILQKRSRSLLTILSIFVGITTIFLFVSFGLGLFNYVNNFMTSSSADKIIIQSKGVAAPGLNKNFILNDNDLNAIKKVSGVYEVTGVKFKVAEIKNNKEKKYTFLIGYDPSKPLLMEFYNVGLEMGRWLYPEEKNKVVVGYNYQLKNKIFSKQFELNNKIKIQGQDAQIVGFFDSIGNPQDDSQIYITNEYMDELYPNENISYGWIVAKVDINKMDQIITDIEKNLRQERGLEKGKEDFYVRSFQDMLSTYKSVLNGIVGFIVLIALISVFVSAINTANTMITSVLERIKEIGIIKSIGARNSEVFKIFLFESSFMGFVAGVVGVILGYILSSSASMILKNLGWGFLNPSYPISLFVGCILFATITGAISGAIPAMKASKINPVNALRYE